MQGERQRQGGDQPNEPAPGSAGLGRDRRQLVPPALLLGPVEAGSGQADGLTRPFGADGEMRAASAERQADARFGEVEARAGKEPDAAVEAKARGKSPFCQRKGAFRPPVWRDRALDVLYLVRFLRGAPRVPAAAQTVLAQTESPVRLTMRP